MQDKTSIPSTESATVNYWTGVILIRNTRQILYSIYRVSRNKTTGHVSSSSGILDRSESAIIRLLDRCILIRNTKQIVYSIYRVCYNKATGQVSSSSGILDRSSIASSESAIIILLDRCHPHQEY
jgi:hypothetical protein